MQRHDIISYDLTKKDKGNMNDEVLVLFFSNYFVTFHLSG